MEVDAGGTPAGERFMTSREVVVHKKEQRVEKAAEAKAAKAKARQKVIDIDGVQYVDKPAPDPDGESLIRPLRLNDGEGASDLRSLEEKWGSRLRLQCSDDEIFHRLTGTHQRVCEDAWMPKLTGIELQDDCRGISRPDPCRQSSGEGNLHDRTRSTSRR